MLALFRRIGASTYRFSKMRTVEQLLSQLRTEDGKSLLDSGAVVKHTTNDLKVDVQLRLDREYRRIRTMIREELIKEGYKDVNVSLAPKDQPEGKGDTRKGNLKSVKKIIAVSSCKGGVGKSTVAINLACMLKEQGLKVGIFDADIFGPSLPTLINKEGETLRAMPDNPRDIEPIEFDGLKCMSFGFAANRSAVMRGPMVSSVVSQLLYNTRWDELDFLVIDMPPGTGDIQITVCQEVKLDGAVIVTTPQRLAFVDVIKGIEMFNSLQVRLLGVVENMAYHECPRCKNHDDVFGRGYLNMLVEQFGIKNSVQIPLNGEISKFSDFGSPVVLTLPKEHAVVRAYAQLVNRLLVEVEKPYLIPNVYYSPDSKKVVVQAQQSRREINPYELRVKCKCAGCIDEFTGEQILKKEKIPQDVHPVRVEEKGNYAVAIVWSDGHRSSIYPYERLLGKDFEPQTSSS